MSDCTSLYVLKNLHTDEYEEALLHHSISDQHIDHVENHWKPILQNHLSKLLEKHKYGTKKYDPVALFNAAGEYNIQDAKWDWRKKHNVFSHTFGYCGCALVCNDMTQGLGYFDISQKYKSRIETGNPVSVVYVEFIATAPWNRNEIEKQQYAGVGLSLINHAINISIEEGLDGRIGLHSLPQSEAFYEKKCGMTNLKPDPEKDNMHYFEMTHEQAMNFISKVK